MEKNQRNPRRRLNSLILLVAFTAVMLIVSTYAWFTAQKTVMIGNLEGKVNVAEGIEISLDAVNWSQEIDFTKFADTGVGQYKADLSKVYGDTDDPAHNLTPSELIPVTTTGKENTTNAATGGNEIKFYSAVAKENSALSTVAIDEINEAKANVTDSSNKNFGGYFAIDLFLRNSSKLGTGETAGTAFETLQLNTSSNAQLVSGGSVTTGLQNTVRVALALYQPTTAADVSITETDQSKILAATTGSTATIKDVAIWEPNADQHVTDILRTNNKIKWSEADANLYLTTAVEMGTPASEKTGAARLDSNKWAEFLANEMTPTYALTGITSDGANRIDDVYDWDGSQTKFAKQVALQTKKAAAEGNYTTVDGGVRNLISSKTSTGEDVYEYGYGSKTTADNVVSGITAETGAAEFQIYKNLIQRVRMYVWLEGQDVDCTNYASHGSGIHLDLGLVKGAKVGGVAES